MFLSRTVQTTIIANVRHALLHECAFRIMRKQIHTVATPVARNAYEAGGVWRSLRLMGLWSQVMGFVLVRLAAV